MKFHPSLYAPPEEGFLWKDRGGDYICCPVGKGAIHFETLLPEILNNGFTGYIGLEPHVPPHALAHALPRPSISSKGTSSTSIKENRNESRCC